MTVGCRLLRSLFVWTLGAYADCAAPVMTCSFYIHISYTVRSSQKGPGQGALSVCPLGGLGPGGGELRAEIDCDKAFPEQVSKHFAPGVRPTPGAASEQTSQLKKRIRQGLVDSSASCEAYREPLLIGCFECASQSFGLQNLDPAPWPDVGQTLRSQLSKGRSIDPGSSPSALLQRDSMCCTLCISPPYA